jgi:outer membrane protein OmpA-like peptidoglycan-associated protein
MLFNYNSVTPLTKTLWVTDSITFDKQVENLTKILIENPGIVLQIDGHTSSNEKIPDSLSIRRARFVRNELTKKNINPQRLKCIGWGKTQLLVTNSSITKAKTQKEKDELHQKNRRVTFKILSFDFAELKKGSNDTKEKED